MHDLITCESKVQVDVFLGSYWVFDPRHMTRYLPIGKHIRVGRYNKMFLPARLFFPRWQLHFNINSNNPPLLHQVIAAAHTYPSPTTYYPGEYKLQRVRCFIWQKRQKSKIYWQIHLLLHVWSDLSSNRGKPKTNANVKRGQWWDRLRNENFSN